MMKSTCNLPKKKQPVGEEGGGGGLKLIGLRTNMIPGVSCYVKLSSGGRVPSYDPCR